MNRLTNLILALILTGALSIPILMIAFAIRLTSKGPAFHWSTRVGRNNVFFKMPKLRTMRIDTPDVATHLFTDPQKYVTPLGRFLRKTSLDELPQLWSVINGDMAFVGPRPALHNQDDLVELRTRYNVHTLTPGITGWAQIQGRDELPIPKKVEKDVHYLKNRSLWLDLKVLWLTVFAVLKNKGVQH